MPTATLTSKGQVFLPLTRRIVFDLKTGQKLDFLSDGDGFRFGGFEVRHGRAAWPFCRQSFVARQLGNHG